MVSTLEDINFWIVYTWVYVVVHRTVLCSEVLGTAVQGLVIIIMSVSYTNNIQCRCSLRAELAMKDKNRFLHWVSTARWSRLRCIDTQKEILNFCRGVDVHSSLYVPTLILIVKTAVYDLVRHDLVVV